MQYSTNEKFFLKFINKTDFVTVSPVGFLKMIKNLLLKFCYNSYIRTIKLICK